MKIRSDVMERIIKGEFFTVNFVKRTDGTERTMKAKFGVKKHLKGGEPAYDYADKGLLPVFDMEKGEYRCFSVELIKWIKIGGETIKAKELLQ